jgi:hypothetical protein
MSAREMHMAFERRLHLISPDTVLANKPTTDDISHYLSLAQERYIKLQFSANDQWPAYAVTHGLTRNLDSIKGLLCRRQLLFDVNLARIDTGATTYSPNKPADGIYTFYLPGFEPTSLPNKDGVSTTYSSAYTKDKYFLYVSSWCKTVSSWKRDKITPIVADNVIRINNVIINPEDEDLFVTTEYNKPIMEVPGVILYPGKIKVVVDAYTELATTAVGDIVGGEDAATPAKILSPVLGLVFYKQPEQILVVESGGKPASNGSLPEDVHSELVDLAVSIFIEEHKYRLQLPRQSNQQQQQQAEQ